MNKKEKKELLKKSILHQAGILTGDDWETVNFPSYLNVDRILDYVLCVSDLIDNLGDHSLLDEMFYESNDAGIPEGSRLHEE